MASWKLSRTLKQRTRGQASMIAVKRKTAKATQLKMAKAMEMEPKITVANTLVQIDIPVDDRIP